MSLEFWIWDFVFTENLFAVYASIFLVYCGIIDIVIVIRGKDVCCFDKKKVLIRQRIFRFGFYFSYVLKYHKYDIRIRMRIRFRIQHKSFFWLTLYRTVSFDTFFEFLKIKPLKFGFQEDSFEGYRFVCGWGVNRFSRFSRKCNWKPIFTLLDENCLQCSFIWKKWFFS